MKIHKYLLIVLFLSLLIAPNIAMIFNKNVSFEASSYHPKVLLLEFKAFYAEHYGFKETLLTDYISFKKTILNENALPNRIVEADNNWWFLGNHYNNSLNDAFGVEKFTENDLFKISEYLESWKDYLNRKNIAFYVLIPSDKNKIYKEKLPFKMVSKPTRVEQLKHYLKNRNLDIIDLTETLLEAKKRNAIYLKNDTHWNSLGAFKGYEHLIKTIQEDITIKQEPLGDYSYKYEKNFHGDIPRLVYQQNPTTKPYLDKTFYNSTELFNDDYERHYKNETKEKNILVFHDSFMLAMMPFINETFKNSRYLKSIQLDHLKIEAYQPDIVVLELVERNLSDLISLKKPLEN
jgi:alginate O-acetyltransferase complex protein AlgJ